MIELSRGRSVGPYVRRSVGLSSALWKNSRSDPDAVWHHRSDGFRDEAGSGVWVSVHVKGYFWRRIWGVLLSTGTTYRTYMCYSAAMQPSCQITLGRLVITVIIMDYIRMTAAGWFISFLASVASISQSHKNL